jgi:hypothetical protein
MPVRLDKAVVLFFRETKPLLEAGATDPRSSCPAAGAVNACSPALYLHQSACRPVRPPATAA